MKTAAQSLHIRGNVIGEKKFFAVDSPVVDSPSEEYNYKYECDKVGNWVRQTIFRKVKNCGDTQTTYEPKIEYY